MSPQLEREGEKDILLHKDENVRRKVGQTFQIWRRNLCETYILPNGLVATQTHTGEEILPNRLKAVKTKILIFRIIFITILKHRLGKYNGSDS